jgi:hypothetical protein
MDPTPYENGNGIQTAGRESGRGPLLEAFLAQFDRLKGFVMAMGLSVADAEDVLQDVSLQVLRRADTAGPDANPAAWLFKVTAKREEQIERVLSRLLPVLETPLHTHPACHFVSGNTPAISPMTLTSSEPEGMTILAF